MIPRAALVLGLAGLLPFFWGAVSQLWPGLNDWGIRWLGPRFVGPYVSLAYGTVILSFMSGVLWGFATRARGAEAVLGYGLSVIPALWAFFFIGGGPVSAAIYLASGFVLLLLLDAMFWKQGFAPEWWMRLRVLLTGVVLVCLAVPIFA
jgi:multidrug transporter EmrE-like cation transporter